MLIAEYDYATDVEVQREESFQLGRSEGIAQGRSEGIAQGMTQGSHDKAVETAREMLNLNMDFETISKISGLTVEEIEDIK